MRLDARLHPLGPASREALARLAPDADTRSGRTAVPSTDPALKAILAAGDGADGFWVSGEATLPARETSSCAWFEAVCRLVLRERGDDYERNAAAVAASPLRPGGIRLVDGLSLTHVALKPNAVGAIGDWTGEFAAGSALVKILTDEGCTGLRLLPLRNTRTGSAHDGVRQLFSDSILPAAVVDESVETIVSRAPEENGALRHLGLLAYPRDALRDARDFNRTAEPWAGWHGFPSWVVSARVHALFRESKIRGWAFRPVLLAEEPLYAEYRAQWRRLAALVKASRKSSFDGARW